MATATKISSKGEYSDPLENRPKESATSTAHRVSINVTFSYPRYEPSKSPSECPFLFEQITPGRDLGEVDRIPAEELTHKMENDPMPYRRVFISHST